MSDTETTIIRPLDVGETQFWLFDKVSTTNFSVFARSKGPLDTNALQSSLRRLQSRYPLTQVGIQKSSGSNKLQFVLKENDIPLQIKGVGNNWQQVLAADTMQSFDTAVAPLLRAFVYLIEENQWVFSLVFHHSVADGLSGIRFFKDVLSHLGSSQTRCTEKKRSVPMHELLPDSVTEKLENPGILHVPESKNLPAFSSKKGTIKPDLAFLKLEKESLTAIRKKAVENAVSLHGVLGAAQLKAIASLYDEYSLKNIPLNLTTPADARSHLKCEMDETDLGLYTTILTSHFEVCESTPFRELARAITRNVKSQLQGREGLLFYKRLSDPTQFIKKESSLKMFSLLMQLTPHQVY